MYFFTLINIFFYSVCMLIGFVNLYLCYHLILRNKMHKDTTKIKAKTVRFIHRGFSGKEFLLECRVTIWPFEDENGAPQLPSVDVEIMRTEDMSGFPINVESLPKQVIQEIEYIAGEYCEYDCSVPRFFSDELQQAEMWMKEKKDAFFAALSAQEEAERRYREARRHHRDAEEEVNRIKSIANTKYDY